MPNAASYPTLDIKAPQAPLSDVVDHIVAVHHGYLRAEMPRIRKALSDALAEAGPNYVQLNQLAGLFNLFASSMESHMRREEQVTFPLVRQLDFAVRRGWSYGGGLEQSFGELCHEHTEARHTLALLRDLTNNYTYPEEASEAVRRLYRGLAALDADTHRHMDVEEQVLFPRALAAEASLRAGEFELHPFPPVAD